MYGTSNYFDALGKMVDILIKEGEDSIYTRDLSDSWRSFLS